MVDSSSATQQSKHTIEQYLHHVADTLRPFKACEKVGDGLYLLCADGEVSVGKKMTRELLSYGYAVEAVHNNTLRVRKIDLSQDGLVFREDCSLNKESDQR